MFVTLVEVKFMLFLEFARLFRWRQGVPELRVVLYFWRGVFCFASASLKLLFWLEFSVGRSIDFCSFVGDC